ncbi:DUF1028 domain-containing protein [Promethearchaeum syntrophicum]|uniref:DUF1028 domain-containing protein n=1 Tax=Promethearchaeum syntrophicum TaxID=2594042 RepID=A0A5B9DAP3_9ARCH
MTFSIVAFDPKTGDLGVAVQSKFPCVGSVVPWAKANVGAIATQAFVNTTYGPMGLKLLEEGYSASEVLSKLLKDDDLREQRQVGIIDAKGNAVAFTGKECFYWAGQVVGENFSCQGNILVSDETVRSMAEAFKETEGDLADKLLAVLSAADEEGRGDVRGKQSANLLIVREKGGYGGYTDIMVDIRVDDHKEPIKELKRIFHIYDMIMLEREDPMNLIKIEGDVSLNIKRVLIELGYLKKDPNKISDLWEEIDSKAFENWIGINNYENKWKTDGTVWKSVYNYLIKEKGTPMVQLKKMSEI